MSDSLSKNKRWAAVRHEWQLRNHLEFIDLDEIVDAVALRYLGHSLDQHSLDHGNEVGTFLVRELLELWVKAAAFLGLDASVDRVEKSMDDGELDGDFYLHSQCRYLVTRDSREGYVAFDRLTDDEKRDALAALTVSAQTANRELENAELLFAFLSPFFETNESTTRDAAHRRDELIGMAMDR